MKDLIKNLKACTNSDNYRIRAAAYTALGNFACSEDVLDEIIKGIEDSHPQVKLAAVNSLKRIYNEKSELEFFQKWLYEINELSKIS